MMNDKDKFMLTRCNADKEQTKVFANRVMFHRRCKIKNKMALLDMCCMQLHDLSNQLK